MIELAAQHGNSGITMHFVTLNSMCGLISGAFFCCSKDPLLSRGGRISVRLSEYLVFYC